MQSSSEKSSSGVSILLRSLTAQWRHKLPLTEILGSLRKPRRQFNGNVAKQKFEWAEQWLYTCVKFLVHFFALLCETTTWDDQILRRLEKLNHDR